MLKQIQKDDIEPLLKIIPDYIDETYPEEGYKIEDLRKFLEVIIASPNMDMIIYYENEEIVGFISFNALQDTFDSSKISLIAHSIYIMPEKRNFKIFKKMMGGLEYIAEAIKAHRILMGCPYNNFKFYEKLYKKYGYKKYECIFMRDLNETD